MLLDFVERDVILHEEVFRALAVRPCHCVPFLKRIQTHLFVGLSSCRVHFLHDEVETLSPADIIASNASYDLLDDIMLGEDKLLGFCLVRKFDKELLIHSVLLS